MKRSLRMLLPLALAVLSAGALAAGQGGLCPMMVKGTKVTYQDAEGGGALVFTTTGDVKELRDRVKTMAEHHEACCGAQAGAAGSCPCCQGQECKQGTNCPCAQGTGPGAMRGHAMHGMAMLPASKATTEEVQGGIKLTIAAVNPADVPQLRERLRQRADMMNEGQCPMMQHPVPPPATGKG